MKSEAKNLTSAWIKAVDCAMHRNGCPDALAEAVEYVELVYAFDQEVANGYTALAWCLRDSEPDSAALWQLARRDIESGRLNQEYILPSILLALRANAADEALELLYRGLPDLRNEDVAVAATAMRYLDKQVRYDHANGMIAFEAPVDPNSSAWLISLAQAYAETQQPFERVPTLVEKAYSLTSDRKDAFARCAWIHFRPKKQLEHLIQWLEKDHRAGRLSPVWKINLARTYAESGQVERSWPLIEEAYSADETLQDGYAICAWKQYRPQNNNAKLILWMEKDHSAGRLSPVWKVNLARTYAESGQGERSWPLIEEAYSADETLQDGYATCAWKHFHPQQKFEKLIHWMEKENQDGRLSSKWKVKLARAYAESGQIENSWPLIEDAYRSDATLNDGYARCAWVHFWPAKRFTDLIRFMEMDNALKRISPAQKINLAKAYAASEKLDEAKTLAGEAYAEDPSLGDAYAEIARVYHAPRKEYSKFLELCSKDAALGRLSTKGAYITAESHMLCGNFNAAISLLDEYHCQDPLHWARAAQHWADSMLWPISAVPGDDQVMLSIVQNMHRSADVPAEARERLHLANASIAIMRERISRMSQRTGIDLHDQLRCIAAHQDASQPLTDPLPFLNAKLHCPNASDLFVLFNELVLSESDFFYTDKKDPLIIDGGTNIGTSLAYFKWLYPDSRIIAFEPNPQLYRICLNNIELNQWPHVTLLPYALAEQRGTATFHCDEVMPMASTLTMRPEEEGRNFTPVEVETRALHEFITGNVDFLKLDIEGAECEVLSSTRQHLPQVKAGLIEYHHGSPQNSLPRILDILEQVGMRYVIKEPFHIRHETSIKTNTPRWSRSIYFGE